MDPNNVTLSVFAKWRAIKGYERLYMVNSDGLVKRNAVTLVKSNGVLCPVKERSVKQRLGRGEYYTVSLTNSQVTRTHYVHRLVAEAYVENPDGKPFVNHKNGIKTDNRAENLEWVTHRENIQHAFDTGLSKAVGKKHPNATRVINVCTGEFWETINDAAEAMGLKPNILRYKLSKKKLKCLQKQCLSKLFSEFPFNNN